MTRPASVTSEDSTRDSSLALAWSALDSDTTWAATGR